MPSVFVGVDCEHLARCIAVDLEYDSLIEFIAGIADWVGDSEFDDRLLALAKKRAEKGSDEPPN